jgi:hypothetical protein
MSQARAAFVIPANRHVSKKNSFQSAGKSIAGKNIVETCLWKPKWESEKQCFFHLFVLFSV